VIVAGNHRAVTVTKSDGSHFYTSGFPDKKRHRQGEDSTDPPLNLGAYKQVFSGPLGEIPERGRGLNVFLPTVTIKQFAISRFCGVRTRSES
jgi:hypothetical protein